MTNPTPELEAISRAIAEAFGDNLDHTFANKSEWNAARGEKGGRFRDINEPFRDDYFDAAKAALLALQEPTEGMLQASPIYNRERGANVWRAMIGVILGEQA